MLSEEVIRLRSELEKLRSEENLILNAVCDGVHGIDADGLITFENPAAARMLGWEIRELIGRPAHLTMHHSHADHHDYKAEECPIYRTLRDGETRRVRGEVFWRRDGTSFPVEYVCAPVRNGDEVAGAVVTFQDISERQAAEMEVQRVKARLQHLVSSIPTVLYSLSFQQDEQRIILAWISENVFALTGFRSEEAISNPTWWLDQLHPDDRPRLEHRDWSAAADQRVLEYRFRRKDGTYLWTRDEVRLLRDANGNAVELVGSWSDLTAEKAAEGARREQEEHYRLLFYNNPMPMWLVEPETHRLLDVNEAALRQYGYSREEMLAMRIEDIVWPSELPAALKAANAPVGHTCVGIRRHRRKDGSIVAMEVHTSIVSFGSKIVQFGMGNDVTEREASQEQIRRNEAALALAQQVARLGSWEMDLNDIENARANPLRCSEETRRIFGFDPSDEEVQLDRFCDAIHPEDRERLGAAYCQMLNGAGRYSLDHRIILPDRAERVVHQEARLIFDHDPARPVKIAGTVQDITERKLAEERLREQAELLDRAHDGIMVRDLDGRILSWNRGAESIYGWTAAEAIGQLAGELLYTDPAEHDRLWREIINKGDWTGELRQVGKNGSELILNSRWTLLRNDKGEPKSVLVINSNITQHKKLELQFLRAQRLESIGTLASGVAHDLNNILAPILMASSVLRGELPPAQRDRILDSIESSAERGAEIVRQILTFARGQKGERHLVQPLHLIKEIVKMAQETFPKSIEVRARYSPGVWAVHASPAQLHQVLLNLCVNARDAMPAGGKLILSAENLTVDEQYASMMPGATPGPHTVIEVSDTGAGIPREIIDRIFDPFFTTKEVGEGTGLGLSTVVGIVKSHGGFITVSSEIRSGTTFKVFLPAVGEAASSCGEDNGASEPAGGNGELILIVDDEPKIPEVGKAILQAHGYRVAIANDGPEALGIFAERKSEIKVVITDVMMPLIDGVTLIRTLRKMSPGITVIASTGRHDDPRINELKALDVPLCLTKPYNKKTLLRALADALAVREDTAGGQEG